MLCVLCFGHYAIFVYSEPKKSVLFVKELFLFTRLFLAQVFITEIFIQVREHAAGVLAGLMKGGDEDLVEDFRRRAYEQANALLKKRRHRLFNCFRFLFILVPF